ncbi:cobalt-precorrin 5A hydrolase [Desulfocicer niacini]
MAFVPEKICIWAITPGGIRLAMNLHQKFCGSDMMVSAGAMAGNELPPGAVVFQTLRTALAESFLRYDAHVCIFSTGIAVRLLAPLLVSKLHDPAVVVMDDKGMHAISLVSGHLGGANELAHRVAGVTGARPVITTATDVNDLPSIDMIAKACGLIIDNPDMIKTVNMAFLRKERMGLIDPLPCLVKAIPRRFWAEQETNVKKEVFIQCSDRVFSVPRETLVLRPRSLVVGMGCNRGTSKTELMALLTSSFSDFGLSLKSLAALATTEVKADEPGLLSLAETLNLPLEFYDKDALNSVENIQNPSKMVEKYLGVKSVCEAAAILASHNGKLVVPKIKKGNATLAVSRIEPDFL